MKQIAIHAENLGKMYRLGETHRSRAGARAPGAAPAPGEEREFWALRGVDLELLEGESLGIVGGNGAGKSTLLKLLSRITAPTTGRALVRGRLASLLEVGTGFHPELTGRENVFLNGTILGMRKAEVARKFDEIIAFAGVEKFIDTPVKRYSSGMYVRLAFAVAAHLEPDILIVDEVLAVGDLAFQQRCLGKMENVAGQGRTVLFVSHNMAAVKKLCSRAIWLAGGQLRASGATADVVAQYLLDSRNEGGASGVPGRLFEGEAGGAASKVLRVELSGTDGPADSGATGEPARFRIRFRVEESFPSFAVELSLATTEGLAVVLSRTHATQGMAISVSPGCYEIECAFPRLPLAAGEYALGVTLLVPLMNMRGRQQPGVERRPLRVLYEPDLCRLHVEERDVYGTGQPPRNPQCLVESDSRWGDPTAIQPEGVVDA